jgi:hypothetical protein
VANVINILDYPCGSGKTTQMIKGFEVGRKYLVIVPLLSEVQRVICQSKGVVFVQPHEKDNEANTKTSSLEAQLLHGLNIVTTHKMYERLVPMVHEGLLDDYDIIIDEVPDVVKSITSKSKTSIDEFYVDAGYMNVDVVTGLVRPTQKWWQNRDEVSDTLSPKILKYAETGCLYLQDGKMFIWALPESILKAGRSVTIMTFKAEGSMLLAYLRKLGLPYEVSNDNYLEEDFRRKAVELITLEDIGSLSKTPLTFTAQTKGIALASYCSKIVHSLKNLRERKLKDVKPDNILLTCKKDAWIKASNDNEVEHTQLAKHSRLKASNWIPNTTRGTNDYIHCSHLIYLYDQHINPVIARWLGNNTQKFKDAYALTELIQWIWRSRIRRGEPITVYLPSPRMRGLFERWLYGEEAED